MRFETAKKLLEENQRIYNEVARDFARTRQGKWSDLLPFLKFVKNGDRLLDVGSGSGRLYEALRGQDLEFFGIDSSEEMIKFCREKFGQDSKTHFELGDILKIPFPDNYFDAVFCLATLHHIPSCELRLKALRELQRVIKPNGQLIMTNWYWWRLPAIFIIFKFWFKKISKVRDLDFGDIFVSWGKQGWRYYHSFRKQELKKLLREAGFKNINQHLAHKRGDHWGKRVNLITNAEK